MEKDRQNLVLYANSICNLNCNYCFIKKLPGLADVDRKLAECYDTNYFVDFTRELFPDKNQLNTIEIWGGEPTLSFKRILPTLKNLLLIYPNIDTINFSSNFASDVCIENIWLLLQEINKYTQQENINIDIQISIDGPKSITDENRGLNTTRKIVKNFSLFLSQIDEQLNILNNISISVHNKSTLSLENIKTLQTKNKIIEYYKFLDSFGTAADVVKSKRFKYFSTIPNTAVPQPTTKYYGELFSNFCKICAEINQDKIFKNYTNIIPFVLQSKKAVGLQNCNCGICGQGKITFGLLPNKLVSLCHDGFTTLVEESDKFLTYDSALEPIFFETTTLKTPAVFPISELNKHEELVECFYCKNSSNMLKAVVGEIQTCVAGNLILSKYSNFNIALDAAKFIIKSYNYCVRDNWKITGSQLLIPYDGIILLLNGALDIIKENMDFE